MDVPAIENADRRAVPRQGRADQAEPARAASRARLGDTGALDCPLGLRLETPRQGRRPDLRQRQRRGGARRGLWRCDGVRLVSDHPVLVARRGLRGALLSAAPRPGDEKESLRDHSGRGRTGLDRHGDRRRLERRPRVHRDLRPRHLADAGIYRPRVFRRDPGGHFRHPARQPVDRHADPHAAGRHPVGRLRLARRHQARAAVPAGPERIVHLRRRRPRPRRPAADPGLRDDGPRHRHERLARAAAQMGPRPPATTAARS